MVAGLIYIDNMKRSSKIWRTVRQSLLLALVERKVLRYMQGLDAIVKKLRRISFSSCSRRRTCRS